MAKKYEPAYIIVSRGSRREKVGARSTFSEAVRAITEMALGAYGDSQPVRLGIAYRASDGIIQDLGFEITVGGWDR